MPYGRTMQPWPPSLLNLASRDRDLHTVVVVVVHLLFIIATYLYPPLANNNNNNNGFGSIARLVSFACTTKTTFLTGNMSSESLYNPADFGELWQYSGVAVQ